MQSTISTIDRIFPSTFERQPFLTCKFVLFKTIVPVFIKNKPRKINLTKPS
ncbi:hypothetical protein C7S15_7475 [Burkholderia cepacia]|nr:hypothetical protein [Burkholderia cepacia]